MDKKIINNIVSLFGIQGMNYFIPLITLPYLVKTLGPESYGVLGFSIAFIQYFCLIADYGFNLSASRKVAMYSSDKFEVSRIFWHVIICKGMLAILGIFILVIACHAVPYLKMQQDVIWAAYGLVIGNILFPVWLFQGKEQMGFSSLANILSRAASIPLIFIFVKGEGDAWIAAAITSVTAIFGGLISIFVLWQKKWILFEKIECKRIVAEYRDGWHVFLSTAAVSLYTTSITVVLGFVAGPIAVGYFVAADKLRQAVQGLLLPISQALYPRINSLMVTQPELAFVFLRKLLQYFSLGGLLLSLSIIICAPFGVSLLYGELYQSSVTVLYILAFCPFLVSVSNVLGIQTMLVLGFNKAFSGVLICSGILCLAMIFPFSFFWKEAGAAWVVLFTESSVTLMMLIFIWYKKIPLYRKSV
ncbi:flippase [Aeromonas taiwanensis]|uniref:flippase n=1 Tax=Aeromonas taiwanensis TaxID=633417 RepID=UPI003988E7EF